MHLVTLSVAGRAAAGVQTGEEVLDLGAAALVLPAAGLVPDSVRGILEAGDVVAITVKEIGTLSNPVGAA